MTDNCSNTYLCKPRNQAYICHIWVNQLLVDMCKFHHLISFDGKIYLDGDIFLLIEFQQFFRCCRSVASSNSHCCTEIQILFLEPVHFTFNTFIFKIEKILKGSPDSLSPSEKIQIMGMKVCLRCKGKTLLVVVNKLFF